MDFSQKRSDQYSFTPRFLSRTLCIFLQQVKNPGPTGWFKEKSASIFGLFKVELPELWVWWERYCPRTRSWLWNVSSLLLQGEVWVPAPEVTPAQIYVSGHAWPRNLRMFTKPRMDSYLSVSYTYWTRGRNTCLDPFCYQLVQRTDLKPHKKFWGSCSLYIRFL